MGDQREAFAKRREALGFTQQTFAEQLKAELSAVGRWERGTQTPQAWRRPRIAELLRVSLDELDVLLNPASNLVRAATSNRREVMVDDALLAEGPASHRAGKRGEDSRRSRLDPAGLSARIADLHRRYQAARYADVAQRLPSVREAVNDLIIEIPAQKRREARRLQCSLEIVAAKLATKRGDGEAGLAAAELARMAAETAEDTFGLAAAAYQRACALLRTSGTEGSEQMRDAEELAVSAAAALRDQDAASTTWRGALTLIGAVIAARRADHAEADERLDHADELAVRLGVDGNIGWTAFGPSNVLIHRTAVSVALNDPHRALATAEQLDITGLPAGLNGRQAQFHLDSAWAHTRLNEDPQAVIHLLETERVAPELVQANSNARSLITELLARERRVEVPALRGLAVRAGAAV
ncbi:XRE family transcriptional regulator [Amycolatopsis thailandensis]|uniref:helix-turn-helix domain-containing protein n=1 Tax=Amycolatopsis thailandensis TaxID=589330 RepID=UPI0036652860